MDDVDKLIKDYEKANDDFIKEQEEKIRNSDSEFEKEIAQDLIELTSGRETYESLQNKKHKKLSGRWSLYLSENRVDENSIIRCKKCGYKRYPYKEYGIDKYHCPNCRGEYAIVNDDKHYVPNKVNKGERIFNFILGFLILLYAFFSLFQPSIFILIVGKTNYVFLEYTDFARIPAMTLLLSVVVYLLSYIFDHYDKRNNEYMYGNIRFYSGMGVFIFFLLAVFVQSYQTEFL